MELDDTDVNEIFRALFEIRADTREILAVHGRTTMKRKRKSREETIEGLLRTDPALRRLKDAIERRGGKAPMTEADSAELTRRLQTRIAQLERRREAS
jgi:hypothetical protein